MVLALICSVLVAGAAVGLRPLQEANRKLDRKKNILRAAGLYQGKGDVEELFQQVETKVVRLADGTLFRPRRLILRNLTNSALSRARRPAESWARKRIRRD